MIAVDTNVLLRRLLDDDPDQAAKANRLFDAEPEILITDVVLAETVWTLTGKRYNAGKQVVVDTISSLLQEPNIVFESWQSAWSALNEFGEARNVDFADVLIVHKARATARRTGRTYRATYTFDKALLALEGAEAL